MSDVLELLQGTTPDLVIRIPSTIPVTSVNKVELTFLHRSKKTILGKTDVSLDSAENTITYVFPERFTLALDPDQKMFWQLRLYVGNRVFGTKKKEISIEDLISTEVLSG